MPRIKACKPVGLLMVIGLALTTCLAGTSVGKGTEGGGKVTDSEPREIVWMVRTDPIENIWEQDVVIPAFEAAHPDIKVNLQIVDQSEMAVKRKAMIVAGKPLHVWSPNWGVDGFASNHARGLITDLTPLIERDNVDISVFISEALDIYQSDGKIWGLPFLTTGSYVFYNMDLFDEAGIEYPPTDWNDRNWTWETYVNLGKKLTRSPENPISAIYGIVQGRQDLKGPAMIFGQDLWPKSAYETGFTPEGITLTTPETINAYKKHHDLIYVDKVSPKETAIQSQGQLDGTFESGNVAMYQTGGWGWWVYPQVSDEIEGSFCWGVAPIPWGSPNAETRAVIYTDPWVITAGLEGQELEDAWRLGKFLIKEETARTFMQTTNIPPTQSKLQEEWFQQFSCMEADSVKEVYLGAFKSGLESSSHLIIRWDELNQIWSNHLSSYFMDPKGNTAEVMQAIETDLNEALARIAEEESQ